MILKEIEYRGYTLTEMRPCKIKCCKIYRNSGVFLQTSNNLKDAKRLVDFCIERGVWS